MILTTCTIYKTQVDSGRLGPTYSTLVHEATLVQECTRWRKNTDQRWRGEVPYPKQYANKHINSNLWPSSKVAVSMSIFWYMESNSGWGVDTGRSHQRNHFFELLKAHGQIEDDGWNQHALPQYHLKTAGTCDICDGAAKTVWQSFWIRLACLVGRISFSYLQLQPQLSSALPHGIIQLKIRKINFVGRCW